MGMILPDAISRLWRCPCTDEVKYIPYAGAKNFSIENNDDKTNGGINNG